MLKGGHLQVDDNTKADGYFTARCLKNTSKKLKLIVTCGEHSASYTINSSAVIPLQFGDGLYTVWLYENIKGTRYAFIGSTKMHVVLKDDLVPYTHPNIYVDYDENSPCVLFANEMCKDLATDADKYDEIRAYIKEAFIFNFIKAITVKKDTLPDIDGCFEKKSGICQDLAAMAAAMLRSQGVPASLVIGHADKTYHAWVRVYLKSGSIVYDPTADVMHTRRKKTHTEERWY